MIELIKGHWNELEGRVVSYSKLSDDLISKKIGTNLFSVYSTQDPLDFVEKIGLGEEGRTMITKMKEEIEKRFTDLAKQNKNISFIPSYVAPIRYEDEKEIIIGNHDVIFAGTWGRLENCIESCQIGATLYSMKHAEQILGKHGFENKKPRQMQNESYTAYTGKPLKNKILNEYVTPILDARNNGEVEQVTITGLKFAHFIEGASFAVDGLELLTLLKTANNPKEYSLINCYLDKIDAIHLEKFEDAAKYRDAITLAKRA